MEHNKEYKIIIQYYHTNLSILLEAWSDNTLSKTALNDAARQIFTQSLNDAVTPKEKNGAIFAPQNLTIFKRESGNKPKKTSLMVEMKRVRNNKHQSSKNNEKATDGPNNMN